MINCSLNGVQTMKTPIIAFLIFSLSLFFPLDSQANELDVRIRIEFGDISSSHREMLENDFVDKVEDYLSRRWTDIDFGNERIPVDITIFFRSASQDYRYSASIVVVSSRPIYNQESNTRVLRINDENWEFSLPPGTPLLFDEYSFNALTSLLDFYSYLIIGMDFDTYEPQGGTPFFERASSIARLAQRAGGRGWDRASTGFSRLGLVEDLLSSRNQEFREAIFHYHYNGLDLLTVDQRRAHESIIESIDTFDRIRSSDPRNLLLRMFFDTKYGEIAEVLLDYPDRSVYDRLSNIDPSHRSTYEEYRIR